MTEQVDIQKLKTLKTDIINYITMNHGLKWRDIFVKAMSDDINYRRSDIMRAVSELVQENRIIRLEYMIPEESSEIHAFYFPLGTKIL